MLAVLFAKKKVFVQSMILPSFARIATAYGLWTNDLQFCCTGEFPIPVLIRLMH